MLLRTDSIAATATSDATVQSVGAYPFLSSMTTDDGTASPASAQGEEQTVRTLFLTGFPHNMHDRELHNLLCFLPGYEACQMSTKPGAGAPPQGFALFSTPAAAQAAVALLNGRLFDAGCHLRCEMAHKNLFLKDDPSIWRADIGRSKPLPLDSFTDAFAALSTHAVGSNLHIGAGGGLSASSLPSALRSMVASYQPAGGNLLAAPAGQPSVMAALESKLALMRGGSPLAGLTVGVGSSNDNPPCNTLFVGNLGDLVNEQELRARFSRLPGFRQLKLLRQPRQVICFVEFIDVATAIAGHTAMQGALLESSDRGPIRIQFSKNPYGKRSPSVPLADGLVAARAYGAAAAAAAAAAGGAGGYPLASVTFPSLGGAQDAAASALIGGVPASMASAFGALAASAGVGVGVNVGDLASWQQHFQVY